MSMYRIANLNFDIAIGKNNLEVQWEKFYIDPLKSNKISCEIEAQVHKLDYRIVNHDIKFAHMDNGLNVMNSEGVILISNADYSKALLQCTKKNTNSLLLAYFFYSHAIKNRMIQMHSSLVKTGKGGLMFVGPSGIGKTTQAELWNKYREAMIINGDVVFVQEIRGEFLGWGTPWHGSSPYCENTSVPLKAMIVLKQAPENSIRELTGFEKVSAVSNNVFYPTWLENGMELCLETLDHLLSRIPVYELSCRPDEEAVKLTEETIFGSSSASDGGL